MREKSKPEFEQTSRSANVVSDRPGEFKFRHRLSATNNSEGRKPDTDLNPWKSQPAQRSEQECLPPVQTPAESTDCRETLEVLNCVLFRRPIVQTYAVDLHTHSRFFHQPPDQFAAYEYLGVRLSKLASQIRGLDGFAVTNHDYYRPETRVDLGVPIPGIEVTTTLGHVVVVGPDPPERTRVGGLSPDEIVDIAHERDCAVILAHPFRGSEVTRSDASFDAVEINGKRPENAGAVRSLARDRDLPIVAGSDAHYPFELGRAFTRIEAEELTARSVARAIQDGRVEPVVRHTFLDEVVRSGYRRLHERKYGD